MNRLSFPFAQIIQEIIDKPADMTQYANKQMARVRDILQNMPPYNCPSSCNFCCHGSILMSYVEYISILATLTEKLSATELEDLLTKRLGILEEQGKLLCPFLEEERSLKHCTLYNERPLICRVFGTTASPCTEDIENPHFPEASFYEAYNLLYYVEDGSFIGLPLTETQALYEAPFDVWTIADSGRVDELLALFLEHGSMRSVICDVVENRFFSILPGGKRLYLDSLDSSEMYP
ncbi:MAG: YkgJ family cysteine cluster protein [Firmicutes bacterium]|nr:YkgJ family cysteine cluster protein [Bacillota bacterium]